MYATRKPTGISARNLREFRYAARPRSDGEGPGGEVTGDGAGATAMAERSKETGVVKQGGREGGRCCGYRQTRKRRGP